MTISFDQEKFNGVAGGASDDYLNCDVWFAQKFDSSRLNHGLARSVVPSGKTIEWEAGFYIKSAVPDWPIETDSQVFELEVRCWLICF